MIRTIGLTNFKCFVQAEIEFGRLNVFAGANGTGKSTIIQALLLLYQSVHSGHLERDRLQLNGRLVDLGTGRDVLYKRSEADRFDLFLRDENQARTIIGYVPAAEQNHILKSLVDPGGSNLDGLKNKLLYLSADRLGPQRSYPMNLDDSSGNEVGRRGEFAPLLYGRTRSQQISNAMLLLENSDKRSFADVESQFSLWMGRLFPGFQVRTENLEQLDSVMLGLNLQREVGAAEYFRPGNVGFGVSVALPVILAGLLADKETTFIVENPEAHLHPSAQSLVGEFLARVAAGGAQVFVETHSDHVVNGMRIAFRNGVLSKDDLSFFAFSKTDAYGSHRITTVQLDESGDFDVRPDTFFDQADKDLKLIYGIG